MVSLNRAAVELTKTLQNGSVEIVKKVLGEVYGESKRLNKRINYSHYFLCLWKDEAILGQLAGIDKEGDFYYFITPPK